MEVDNNKILRDSKKLSDVLLFKHQIERSDYDRNNDLLSFLDKLQTHNQTVSEQAYEVHHVTQMHQDLKRQRGLEKQYLVT